MLLRLHRIVRSLPNELRIQFLEHPKGRDKTINAKKGSSRSSVAKKPNEYAA